MQHTSARDEMTYGLNLVQICDRATFEQARWHGLHNGNAAGPLLEGASAATTQARGGPVARPHVQGERDTWPTKS